ncbi:MAG: RNA-binding S4 domain-containing protein [Bacteroidales bacterium]|nr:RNA-binding S4 domain-containing protein [Bacteroidales bacterium]
MEKTRMDKWLWEVRLFKSRSLATEACNAGKVKVAGTNCKPAREVKVGEEVQVRIGALLRTVRVLDAPKSRIPAVKVPDYYLDLTPPEEYERVRIARMQTEHRDAGIGRPTKRNRRQIEYLKDFLQFTEDGEDE